VDFSSCDIARVQRAAVLDVRSTTAKITAPALSMWLSVGLHQPPPAPDRAPAALCVSLDEWMNRGPGDPVLCAALRCCQSE
jgi:hypothetical protein